jgi:hypothetical protein
MGKSQKGITIFTEKKYGHKCRAIKKQIALNLLGATSLKKFKKYLPPQTKFQSLGILSSYNRKNLNIF